MQPEPGHRAPLIRKALFEDLGHVPQGVAGIVHHQAVKEPRAVPEHELRKAPPHGAGIGLEVAVAQGHLAKRVSQPPQHHGR